MHLFYLVAQLAKVPTTKYSDQMRSSDSQIPLFYIQDSTGDILLLHEIEADLCILSLEFVSGKRNCRQGFPCGGSCINKNKKCQNAANGQPKSHKEYIAHQLTNLSSSSRLAEADAILHTARKIALLKSEKARNLAVAKMRDRLDKDEQLNAVLEAIDLEAGVKNPSVLASNIARFTIKNESENKLKIASKIEVKLLPTADTAEKLNSIVEQELSPKQQEALSLAKDYHAATKSMNSLLKEVKSTMTDDEYAATFTKTSEIANQLKEMSDRGKALQGKVDHPELDEYVNKIASTSKESLPGYQIVVPTDIDKLKEKASKREC